MVYLLLTVHECPFRSSSSQYLIEDMQTCSIASMFSVFSRLFTICAGFWLDLESVKAANKFKVKFSCENRISAAEFLNNHHKQCINWKCIWICVNFLFTNRKRRDIHRGKNKRTMSTYGYACWSNAHNHCCMHLHCCCAEPTGSMHFLVLPCTTLFPCTHIQLDVAYPYIHKERSQTLHT